MRIGQGYDVHKLVEDRDLIIGGVKIPYEKGLLGHSDADVLLQRVSGNLDKTVVDALVVGRPDDGAHLGLDGIPLFLNQFRIAVSAVGIEVELQDLRLDEIRLWIGALHNLVQAERYFR